MKVDEESDLDPESSSVKVTKKEEVGLSNLVRLCFGKPLDKSQQLSNWEFRPLRQAQIMYAGRYRSCDLNVIYDDPVSFYLGRSMPQICIIMIITIVLHTFMVNWFTMYIIMSFFGLIASLFTSALDAYVLLELYRYLRNLEVPIEPVTRTTPLPKLSRRDKIRRRMAEKPPESKDILAQVMLLW